jgi:hypothetical protein
MTAKVPPPPPALGNDSVWRVVGIDILLPLRVGGDVRLVRWDCEG